MIERMEEQIKSLSTSYKTEIEEIEVQIEYIDTLQ